MAETTETDPLLLLLRRICPGSADYSDSPSANTRRREDFCHSGVELLSEKRIGRCVIIVASTVSPTVAEFSKPSLTPARWFAPFAAPHLPRSRVGVRAVRTGGPGRQDVSEHRVPSGRSRRVRNQNFCLIGFA